MELSQHKEILKRLKNTIKEDSLNRLYACFECGQCVSVCSVTRVDTDFRPRKIMHMLLLGLIDELIYSQSIWLCTNCYSCDEICPQGIKVSGIINSLKNMAYRSGNFPSEINRQLDAIRNSGMVYMLDDFDIKKREKAGLPPLSKLIDEAVRLLEIGK